MQTNDTLAGPHELQQLCTARTRDLLLRAAKRFGRRMPKPEIRFDLRGLSAGMLRLTPGRPPEIRYNLQLLMENRREFLDQTVPHEVAHLVVKTIHGNRARAHGQEWQGVMEFFGATASRCHRFDTSRSRTRSLQRYPYRCGCGPQQLTSIRHHRALAGQIYLCRNCKQPLVPDC